MASTQPQWQRDADRQKHYYFSLSENCWIFHDDERIYADNADMGAAGEGGSNSHTIADRRRTFGPRQLPIGPYNNPSRWMQNEKQGDVSANGNNAITHSVYSHGRKPLDDNGSPAYYSGGHISLSWGIVPVTTDDEISRQPLFTGSRSQLHCFDPKNEKISLLVCQHLLRPCRDRCSDLWEHKHIEPGPTAYISNPSACLYQRHSSDEQTLVVDLCNASISTSELKAVLQHATKSYLSYLSEHISKSNPNPPQWAKFHAAELRQYSWLQTYSIQLSVNDVDIMGGFVVSGITCSNCKRWTKIGRVCSRCSEPLKDHLEVDIESALAVASGTVGGLAIGLTIASYLFLSLLTLL